MSSTAPAPAPAPAPARAASTPTKRKPARITDSPGDWRHPRLTEIARRQKATVFSENNVRTILYNIAALVILHVVRLVLKRYGVLPSTSSPAAGYTGWACFALQLAPFYNIGMALMPFFRPQDDMCDIPLTPGQRRLLGLPPSSASPTPGSVYSTPPRYSRTPSISGSVGSNKSYNSSPLSAKASPAPNASTFSPIASPLLHKAMTGGGRRRSSLGSLGSPSPLGASSAGGLFAEAPGTPSPTSGKRSSIGLNNKWLYEKGRRSSGNNWM